MDITMRPIGYIRSPLKTREEAPPQSVYAEELREGFIDIEDEFQEGIKSIKAGSYGVILFYFDRSKGYRLSLIPYRATEERGVFSTRSPNRPNGIGLTIVQFLENDGKTLKFEGVDMLDGTPVLDIKPYNADLNPKE